MNNAYKYENMPLIPTIAAELICEIFLEKGNVNIREIRTQIVQLHEKRGGQPTRRSSPNPVILEGLQILRQSGQATNLGTGIASYWRIHEKESEEGDTDKTVIIGIGKSSVYLYYYPSHRQNARLNKKSEWECKIGKTDDDSHERVRQQTDSPTGLPELPQLGLIIKTDNAKEIERAIHNILIAKGKHKKDAPGKEWFITSPVVVAEIYHNIFEKSVE